MFLDGAHLRFCLRHAHAEMQPGNGDDCGCAARVEQKRVALRERRADFHWVIWFIVKTKMWRKDSDNRVVHSAQGHNFAKSVRISAKSISPEPVADDNYARSAALVFLRRKTPSQRKFYA